MPPRASSAETITTPAAIAEAIERFLAANPDAAIIESGKTLFDLRTAKYTLTTEHERCTLHLWNSEHNLVRTIVAATPRPKRLRLDAERLGQKTTKLLDIIATTERRSPTTRDAARAHYVKVLERVLTRTFPEWKPESFRTAMDLERSFGPAYARGMITRGNQAWAVIGVNETESAAIIDGILTLGILWLHHCREKAEGRKLFQGLKVIVPRGTGMTTLLRMSWLRREAADWELYELNAANEELIERDLEDTGNLRTRLVHRPDETAARERFARAIEQILRLVPQGEEARVQQQLRSTSELAFLIHGLEFARARISLAPNSFSHTLALTVGVGPQETALTPTNRDELAQHVAELFVRRRAVSPSARNPTRQMSIGSKDVVAHSRVTLGRANRAINPAQDPLYRAAPERWLESVLQEDLAPLTRGLAAVKQAEISTSRVMDANDEDNFGNRIEATPQQAAFSRANDHRVIPRLDPRYVYAQVPAIAGASDRGLIDLLGIANDGRLAVIELKASEDLHFALQGLDYWLRVRHHALVDPATGRTDFQKHGYFVDAELSALAPRLYLVAPALRIHPATETVLRYLSPRVEWQLLALDERWREQVRVVWRRQSKT